MNSLLLLLLFFAFTLYQAVKLAIAQNKELQSKIKEHKKRFPDPPRQYIWKDYNPTTIRDFKTAFEQEDLSEKWSFFEKQLKPEIRFKLQSVPENEFELGETKIGGRPDLPRDIEWPKQDNGKHLAFLAQINLDEMNCKELKFPNQGILYFFYSEDQEFWGYSKENANDFRVVYSTNTSELEKSEIPTTFTTLKDGMYQSCKVNLTKSYSLPDWGHEFVNEQFKDCDNAPYIDISSSDGHITKIGGHSTNIQGTMEFECEMVDRGYDWNNIPQDEKEQIEESQYQWQLLFQLDSEEEAKMMWGDGGRLYFWIKEEDLKNRKFDKTWLILQCT